MNRLFIGNVSTKADPNEIKQILEECGKIKYFDIKEGSGFMEFETVDEAEDAIKKLNGSDFQGKELIVEHARKSFPPRGGHRGGRRGNYGRREYRRSRSTSRSRSRSRDRRRHDRSRSRSISHSKSRSRDRNHKKRSRRSGSRS